VQEARWHGADAVLIIVKLFIDNAINTSASQAQIEAQIEALIHEAHHWGMTPVVEVQTIEEMAWVRSQPWSQSDGLPFVWLLNHRNLDTLTLDDQTSHRLAPHLPEGAVWLSASGFSTAEDLVRGGAVNHRFLVGSSLMALPVPDMAATLAQWHNAWQQHAIVEQYAIVEQSSRGIAR
jgi:indole-3-glycerol phosphate synthase